MSNGLVARAAFGAAAVMVCAGAAGAGVLDWGSGWANAESNGWYATQATTNQTVVDGVTIDVELQTFGTATATHNFLPNAPFASDTYNGDQGEGDPALGIGDSNSFNLGDTFDNYVQLTITFSAAVEIESMSVGDVDISNGLAWQDAVAVVGSLGGVDAMTTYTPDETSFFESGTFDFPGSGTSLYGVSGKSQASNDGSDGQFDVAFSTAVDTITLFYWNGPDSNSSSPRGVYIQDIHFVPTPGAAALAGLGLIAAGGRRRR